MSEVATIWVTRANGSVAKVDLPWQDGDVDLWYAIDREFPTSWNILSEDDVLADDVEHMWDARFGPGEDKELSLWLVEGMADYHCDLDGGATVYARRSEGIATVTWTVEGVEVRQTIDLGYGDFERLATGHDPVAEQWEDGNGLLVCVENAEGDVPEAKWAEVLKRARWKPWDQGDRPDEQVQEGEWNGHRVMAVYRIPDQEAFDEALREDEDAAYLDSLASVRMVSNESRGPGHES